MLSETLAVDGIDLTQTSHEEQLQMRNLMKYESCLAFYNLNRNHISLSLSTQSTIRFLCCRAIPRSRSSLGIGGVAFKSSLATQFLCT